MVISLYFSLNIFSLAALFIASECIVILSGESLRISSMVCLTSSIFSLGRPTIKSIFILLNPSFLARLNAVFTSSTVCLLPMISNVSCFMVCGFTEILSILCFFNTSSLSSVMLSGLPASTVYSFKYVKSNNSSTLVITLSNCFAVSVVGVPPPQYTVFSFLPLNFSALYSSSLKRQSTYSSAFLAYAFIGYEVNEQYRHVVGQNGMPIYRL